MTVSPKYDKLIFVVPAAVDNALSRVMARSNGLRAGMPGLRIVAAQDNATYHVVHLPTNARAVFTRHPEYAPEEDVRQLSVSYEKSNYGRFPELGIPLDEVERAALAWLPAISDSAEILLAALVGRLSRLKWEFVVPLSSIIPEVGRLHSVRHR
jgi:hypothetical protein